MPVVAPRYTVECRVTPSVASNELRRVPPREPSLVWVSMTAEPNTDYPKRLRELANELAGESCQVIVGGRQLSDEITRLDLENLHTARSMEKWRERVSDD